MKKILVAAGLIAWAGTLYGAYAWGSRNGPPDGAVTAARAALCSISREDFQDANRALDKVVTFGQVVLPLRAWGRAYGDNTNIDLNVKALVEEAAFQENRRQVAGSLISSNCFAKD